MLAVVLVFRELRGTQSRQASKASAFFLNIKGEIK